MYYSLCFVHSSPPPKVNFQLMKEKKYMEFMSNMSKEAQIDFVVLNIIGYSERLTFLGLSWTIT